MAKAWFQVSEVLAQHGHEPCSDVSRLWPSWSCSIPGLMWVSMSLSGFVQMWATKHRGSQPSLETGPVRNVLFPVEMTQSFPMMVTDFFTNQRENCSKMRFPKVCSTELILCEAYICNRCLFSTGLLRAFIMLMCCLSFPKEKTMQHFSNSFDHNILLSLFFLPFLQNVITSTWEHRFVLSFIISINPSICAKVFT